MKYALANQVSDGRILALVAAFCKTKLALGARELKLPVAAARDSAEHREILFA
jgi:hypothetical protein